MHLLPDLPGPAVLDPGTFLPLSFPGNGKAEARFSRGSWNYEAMDNERRTNQASYS
jgi:hypothetical protein